MLTSQQPYQNVEVRRTTSQHHFSWQLSIRLWLSGGYIHGTGTSCAASSNIASGELQSLHWPALAADRRASSFCSRAHCPVDSTEPGLDALTQLRAACAPFPVSSIVSACRAHNNSALCLCSASLDSALCWAHVLIKYSRPRLHCSAQRHIQAGCPPSATSPFCQCQLCNGRALCRPAGAAASQSHALP